MRSLLKKEEKEEEEREEGQVWTDDVYMHCTIVEEVMGFESRMAWVHISLLILWT